jgi:hypothetical protein
MMTAAYDVFLNQLFLMLMNFPDVNVKHLSHHYFFSQGVAHNIEPDAGTNGAAATHEVVFGLGF